MILFVRSPRAFAASLPLLFATLAPLACGTTGADRGASNASAPPPYTAVSLTSVDKVDLLLAVDDSGGMADAQAILADAAPALVQGLVAPACTDDAGRPTGEHVDPSLGREANLGCPPGARPMFSPVGDMHVGVVSTSLGGMGGDLCADTGSTNGAAHLRTTAKGGRAVSTAASGFLRWFAPSNRRGDPPAGAIVRPDGLASSMADLVTGAGETGCGYPAALETIYRFLVEPDPWTRVAVDGAGHASLGDDVDWTLLAERADFRRPDSLVVVVLLTAKEDSAPDPRAASGLGWAYASRRFPGSTVARADGVTTTAPRATSACATDPAGVRRPAEVRRAGSELQGRDGDRLVRGRDAGLRGDDPRDRRRRPAAERNALLPATLKRAPRVRGRPHARRPVLVEPNDAQGQRLVARRATMTVWRSSKNVARSCGRRLTSAG